MWDVVGGMNHLDGAGEGGHVGYFDVGEKPVLYIVSIPFPDREKSERERRMGML